ncbi:MAG: hypothetical protein ACYCW6_11465 [Candidatus Xenobia bacterium]
MLQSPTPVPPSTLLPAFSAQDVEPGFPPGFPTAEQANIYNAVASLTTMTSAWNAPYGNQVVTGQEPLQFLCFPPTAYASPPPGISLQIGGVTYDPNTDRFQAGGGGTFYNNSSLSPTGITQQQFISGITGPATTAEDLKGCLLCAQRLATDQANFMLASDEQATLTSASQSGVGAIAYPANLPEDFAIEHVNLDLAQWLTRTVHEPSFAVTSWRTF